MIDLEAEYHRAYSIHSPAAAASFTLQCLVWYERSKPFSPGIFSLRPSNTAIFQGEGNILDWKVYWNAGVIGRERSPLTLWMNLLWRNFAHCSENNDNRAWILPECHNFGWWSHLAILRIIGRPLKVQTCFSEKQAISANLQRLIWNWSKFYIVPLWTM